MKSPEKILIVEDDESQRLLYSEELREEGYEPIAAKNGKEAMHLLKKFTIGEKEKGRETNQRGGGER